MRPALVGFRCNANAEYIPIDADDEDRIKSEQLGVYLRAEGTMLRLIDATTGEAVLTKDEFIARMEQRVAQLQAMVEQATGNKAP